jgi:hypothetical protein
MNILHSTKQDVIDHEIVPALTVPGVSAPEEYDIDAIFDQCWAYDAEAGGFVPTADADRFWEVVEASVALLIVVAHAWSGWEDRADACHDLLDLVEANYIGTN